LVALSTFEKNAKYSDISKLKTASRSVTIDKEKSNTLQFYQKRSTLASLKNRILGKITINVNVDQVQLDIFAEYNYLASSIQLEVVGDSQFTDYGVNEITDEHYNANSLYTARNSIRVIGTGDVFDKGTYTLLIKTDSYSKKLFKSLEDNQIAVDEDLNLPITIKIQSTILNEKLETENGALRLIDLEYNGNPDDDGNYLNTENELSIVLEFNDNLDNSNLSFDEDTNFAYLALDKKFHKNVSKKETLIKPSKIDKASVLSENMIQLIFQENSLQKGASYSLILDKRIEINQDLKDAGTLRIRTLMNKCNPKGSIATKDDSSGCKCKFPYSGPSCHQCQDDYKYNPYTQECFIIETCSNDICNHHGTCMVDPESGKAKCICNPGFKDDAEGSH